MGFPENLISREVTREEEKKNDPNGGLIEIFNVKFPNFSGWSVSSQLLKRKNTFAQYVFVILEYGSHPTSIGTNLK